MTHPRLTNLSSLSITPTRESPRAARLDELCCGDKYSGLTISRTVRTIRKPELRLVVNRQLDPSPRSSFAQSMTDYCDALDRQIEEILRL